jgi:hypothetical protein
MRTKIAFGLLVLVVVAGVALAKDDEAKLTGPLSFDLSVVPAKAADTFECQAKVEDLVSGDSVFKPKITFRKGDTGKAQSSFTRAGDAVDCSLEVKVTDDSASYTMKVKVGSKLIGQSKGQIRLK